jgi:predicted nucleic acid-binding protein
LIVIDTNVLVHYWLKSDLNINAERLLEFDSDWIVPLLWRSELRNVLAFYLRKKLIEPEIASQIIMLAESNLVGKEFLVDSVKILNLVNSSKLSAYDCEFVSLAMEFE